MEADKREQQRQAQQVVNVTEEMKRAPSMHEAVPALSAEPQKAPEKVQVQQQPVARQEEVKAATSHSPV